mgnify:CR=1 FL=1
MIWFFILIALNTCGVATFPTKERCEEKRIEIMQQVGATVEYLSECSPQPLPQTRSRRDESPP